MQGVKNNSENIYHCPVCLGSGYFELPSKVRKTDVEIKKWLTVLMHKKGYSIRQIMRALGYRSPQSISLLLKELIKK